MLFGVGAAPANAHLEDFSGEFLGFLLGRPDPELATQLLDLGLHLGSLPFQFHDEKGRRRSGKPAWIIA
jgi:hypothetical protein